MAGTGPKAQEPKAGNGGAQKSKVQGPRAGNGGIPNSRILETKASSVGIPESEGQEPMAGVDKPVAHFQVTVKKFSF